MFDWWHRDYTTDLQKIWAWIKNDLGSFNPLYEVKKRRQKAEQDLAIASRQEWEMLDKIQKEFEKTGIRPDQTAYRIAKKEGMEAVHQYFQELAEKQRKNLGKMEFYDGDDK